MPSDRPEVSRPWRSRAFGLELELDFPAPGLPPLARGAAAETSVSLASPQAISDRWRASAPEVLLDERFEPDGPPARSIEYDPQLGHRLHARHFGTALIEPGAAHVLCSPPDVDPWSWQRFLIGRVLPWASVLRGHECFHASAVAVDGRVVAISGQTGAGKTTLATEMMMRGLPLVSDDVLAIDSSHDGPVAHPGAAIVALREDAHTRIVERIEGIGTVLGESGKIYLAADRVESALPLGAFYLLERSDVDSPRVIASAEPRQLLASTFVSAIATPSRLVRLLDVAAAMASAQLVRRVLVPERIEPERLVDHLLEDATQTMGTG